MKIKSILSIAILSSIFVGCSNDENVILNSKSVTKSDLIESDVFSVNYPYSDTIKVFTINNDFVKIVVSSDNKDVLESHLAKNKYSADDITNLSVQDLQSFMQKSPELLNTKISEFEKCDISSMPKIRIELIETSDSLKTFDVKCKAKEKVNNSGVQKVPFYPTPTYYEYTSPGNRYYGKLKYTNVDDNGYTTYKTQVRYGYQACWLFCGWTQWPTNYFRTLNYWETGYLYDINAFGRDGDNYTGYNIYRLCTGIISYSPYNHECRWGTSPVANW